MKVLRLRLNTKKSVLSPLQRTIYLGVVWDPTAMQACLSLAHIGLNSQESERRPVPYSKAVSETAGSGGSCVQCDTFWPAVHETPTVVAQDQGVLPKGKPALKFQGHEVKHTCLRHVDLSFCLSAGAGSSLSPCNASDGRVPHRLGRSHDWPSCPWPVV